MSTFSLQGLGIEATDLESFNLYDFNHNLTATEDIEPMVVLNVGETVTFTAANLSMNAFAGIVLRTDAAVDVTLDGSIGPISVTQGLVLYGCSHTSIAITGQDTATAKVKLHLIGDA